MSPVEFSNYIKQRTTLQQPPFLQSPNPMMGHNLKPLMSPSRSLSPANHNPSGLSINSDPFYYHNNNANVGGYYGHQQQQQQSYLGSHHQLGYGSTANGLTGGQTVTSSPPGNAISSSISSISSASSSSASSSVSSSSLGEHLLFGGQFTGNNANRMSAPMYNFYATGNEAPFMDNGFFAPLSSAGTNMGVGQYEETELVEANPTKFGVIGGGLSGQGLTSPTVGQQEQTALEGDTNVSGDSPDTGSPNPGSNSMENLQSNAFYSGSSSSPFPQLLVAN